MRKEGQEGELSFIPNQTIINKQVKLNLGPSYAMSIIGLSSSWIIGFLLSLKCSFCEGIALWIHQIP